MNCKNCGKEIKQNETFCKVCGAATDTPPQSDFQTAVPVRTPLTYTPAVQEKKKSHKKLIIIVACAILVLIFLISLFSGDESTTSDNDETASQNNIAVTTTTGPTIPKIDTSISNFYKSFETGEGGDFDYSLSQKSIDYINANTSFFPCKTEEAYTAMASSSISPSFAEIEKSPTKFHNQMSYFSGLEVIEITESPEGDFTYIHMLDDNWNSYVGLIIDTLPDIFTDDLVYVYGLPVDMIYFENQLGGTTEAVFLAISSCRLQSSLAPAEKTESNEDPFLENYLRTDPLSYFENRYYDNYGQELTPTAYTVSTETGDVLNMRSSWSSDSDVIETIPDGYIVLVYGTYNGWAYVQPRNATEYGWINMNYIVPMQ